MLLAGTLFRLMSIDYRVSQFYMISCVVLAVNWAYIVILGGNGKWISPAVGMVVSVLSGSALCNLTHQMVCTTKCKLPNQFDWQCRDPKDSWEVAFGHQLENHQEFLRQVIGLTGPLDQNIV